MSEAFDFSRTFVLLDDRGGADPIRLTPAFWRESARADPRARWAGVYEFSSARDLHSSQQEVHPEADEVLFLVSGAIDVLLDEGDEDRVVALEAGQAAVVPAGVWHRLVMREPGTLLFINSRIGMQSRSVPKRGAGA